LPHPPSPTTTNFFEKASGCVMLVASDMWPLEKLVLVLAVPLLTRTVLL
jgi:hypothetical protein